MPTTPITGALEGLGSEAAVRLISLGHVVWFGARDVENGAAVAAEFGARFVKIDVTDDAPAAEAADVVVWLDELIDNAGISGSWRKAVDTGIVRSPGDRRRRAGTTSHHPPPQRPRSRKCAGAGRF